MKTIQAVLALNVLLCAGCWTISSDVRPLGNDRYTVSATGNAFSSEDRVFGKALEEAQTYCAERGKQFQLGDAGTNTGFTNSNRIVFACK